MPSVELGVVVAFAIVAVAVVAVVAVVGGQEMKPSGDGWSGLHGEMGSKLGRVKDGRNEAVGGIRDVAMRC